MPPKYVQTVRQLIYWHYAHLIARAAGFEGNYGFIVSRYKKLDSGEMNWSTSVRDYQKELDKGKECIYCGETSKIINGPHHPHIARGSRSSNRHALGFLGQLRLCMSILQFKQR